jgi:phosphopantetheine adenylyltransferase
VRGARTGSEFEAEQRMAMANILENPSIRPVFLATRKPELNFVSSTIARDLARHHGESLEMHVTPYVAEKLRARAAEKYPQP